jgi:glycosyltransferase involved in cell wall biosynthesis
MRIVHVFRAPIGGLFRHVIDLAGEQAKRGHDVGVFCDSTFAGDRNEHLLTKLAEHLSLGVRRVEIRRNPNWREPFALRAMSAYASEVKADVLHGHGSKGGVYARLGGLVSGNGPIRAYTPHGGSLNYKPGSTLHRVYMGIERLLERGTDAFLFESQYIADRYEQFVCKTARTSAIVLNGLHPHEMEPVTPEDGAADFLYIGEFRFAKGVDNLIEAFAQLKRRDGRAPSLVLVGQGPDEEALRHQVAAEGLAETVQFRKPMAARDAFTLARTMIVPSRAESMPYVVIEAAGASMPLISTDVGGIPEIFGTEAGRLIPPDDVPALISAMDAAMQTPTAARIEAAERLAAYIRAHFCVTKMTDRVLEAYSTAAQLRPVPHPLASAPVQT